MYECVTFTWAEKFFILYESDYMLGNEDNFFFTYIQNTE